MRNSVVSIVVPVYNAEKTLKKCINSLLNQSYKDIEIILINDGSKDSSQVICERYANEYNNIVTKSIKNSGVSIARNTGLEMSNGDFIMFVDPDDSVDEFLVDKLLGIMEKDNKIDIASCCCKVDISGEFHNNFFYKEDILFEKDSKQELYKQLLKAKYGQPGQTWTAIGVPWGKLYRKTLIEENQLVFAPNMRRLQDNIFNSYAFYYSKKIAYLNEALYVYSVDNINTYAKKNVNELEGIYDRLYKERSEFFKLTNLDNNLEIKNLWLLETFTNYSQIIKIVSLDRNVPFKKKIQKIKALLKNDNFSVCFESSNKFIENPITKVKYFCLKKRYLVTYSILNKFMSLINK